MTFVSKGPVIERFWLYVDPEPNSGCWIWTGQRTVNGYGFFWPGGHWSQTAKALAHRWAYEFYVGPIPQGLTLDHLCRNRPCVNPRHLEPVTLQENCARSPIINANKTHCKNGHEYTPENTVHCNNGVSLARRCRICLSSGRRTEKRRAQKRAAYRRKMQRLSNVQ